MRTCKNCGAYEIQHDRYAQAVGARSIYSWEDGIDIPIVDCERFEPEPPNKEEK